MGKLCPVDHQTDHGLPGLFAPTKKQVPYQSLMGLLIINGNAVLLQKNLYDSKNLTEEMRLQITKMICDNAMAAGCEKTYLNFSVRSAPDGILCFVAVSALEGGRLNRQRRKVDSANAAEMFRHPVLFDLAFGVVGNMPQRTAAALSGNRTCI